MLDRQTTWIEEGEEDEDSEANAMESQHEAKEAQPSSFDMSPMQDGLDSDISVAGFCGRCGKIADTCYCFWNVGALAVATPLSTRAISV